MIYRNSYQLMQHDPAKFQGLSIEKISRFLTTQPAEAGHLLTESALHLRLNHLLPNVIETFLEQSCQLPAGYAASCLDISSRKQHNCWKLTRLFQKGRSHIGEAGGSDADEVQIQ